MTIKEVLKMTKDETYSNKEFIVIEGWVRSLRTFKDIGFIDVYDGSNFSGIQVVFRRTMENFENIQKLLVGSAIKVEGMLFFDKGKDKKNEISANKIEIISLCDEKYYLQKKKHSYEYLRTKPHLRARTTTFSSVFKVRSTVSYLIHKFFFEKGFTYIHSPIISGSDCEGAGEMFKITSLPIYDKKENEKPFSFKDDFFGRETFLTVSGQLEAEAYAMSIGKVYTFGPTFRAENSNTTRHSAEFWMIEPEMAFYDLNDDMDLAESMIKYIIKNILEIMPEEMKFFNDNIDESLIERLSSVSESNFDKISYTDAIDILKKNENMFKNPVFWGADLKTEHEKFLCEEIFKKPLFVTDYPKEIKAFYMKENDDNKTVAAMDCLVPKIGEIIGGSQREESVEKLLERMNKLKIKTRNYEQYLEIRKFGGVPHSGFGLGLERLIMYLTGIPNIRDVISYPRIVNNIY